MTSRTGLLINRLILGGYRKNYEIPFHPGVNIIYGDLDTGKSSILRIVYYLLGSKAIRVDNEIQRSVKDAMLEVEINGTKFSIKRDLYNPKALIEVYSCPISEIEGHFPEKVTADLPKKGTEGFRGISELLMSELNFPAVELKQSPSKQDSGMARLSFRDLFKYCYLDQDEVGSRNMLDASNPPVAVKNREVFKYAFNVLDSNISDLQAEIAMKTKEQNELTREYTTISKFLDSTEIESQSVVDNHVQKIEEEVELLESELAAISKRITSNSDMYSGLKDALVLINGSIAEQNEIRIRSEKNVEKYTRLRNEYVNDIDKIDAAIEARNRIGRVFEPSAVCPLCDSSLTESNMAERFTLAEEGRLSHEMNSLKGRVRDLDSLVEENRNNFTESSNAIEELELEQEKAKKAIDEELSTSISPYLAERDSIISELASVRERRDKYRHILKVRNQHKRISDNIGRLESDLVTLQDKLEILEEKAPSIVGVCDSLGRKLKQYLDEIHIKNPTGVSISQSTFLPVVRGIEYPQVNSGGLRTILSIGHLSGILESKLSMETNFPGLLMIDTVGKYLGKTQDTYDEDDEEDFLEEDISDPNKYANIYRHLISISEKFEDNGRLCQLLLVDNDIPADIIEKYKGFVVAHYRSDGSHGAQVGLIDDWDEAGLSA